MPSRRAAEMTARLDAIVIGPGSFYTSLLPIFLVQGCREAVAEFQGPVVYVSNLMREGRGMHDFTVGHAVTRLESVIDRPVDIVIHNVQPPEGEMRERYAAEHKSPLPLGDLPPHCE